LNNRLYYAYKFFKDTIPIYPVYPILFESKWLTLGQISLLFAIWSVPVVLLEIPTGILADHWNRKRMLVAGSLCKAACYIFWFFSEGFALFAVGFIFWGISEALCSGSEEALLYDSLKLEQKEDRFDKVYGTGSFCSGLGVALSCFAGGVLTEAISYRGVLAASAFMVLLSTLFALGFKEVNYYRTGMGDSDGEISHKPLSTLMDSLDFCIKNKMLMVMVLMLVLVVGVAGILDEFDPLIADSFKLSLGLIGFWIGFRYILEAVGSKTAYLIKTAFAKRNITDSFFIVFVLCIVSGVCLTTFGLLHQAAAIPLYGLFYMLMAAAVILQEDYVQKRIEEQGRSTVHSIISLMHNLYGTVFFIAVSAASGIGIQALLILLGSYILLLSLIILIWYLSVKSRPARQA
jgi:MFS family permease